MADSLPASGPLKFSEMGDVVRGQAVGTEQPLSDIFADSNEQAIWPPGDNVSPHNSSELYSYPMISDTFDWDPASWACEISEALGAPTAVATSTTVSSGTAQVDGSTSFDPDGTITAYFWEQTSGPTTTIVSPNAAVSNVTGIDWEGDYVYQLTVTDNDSLTDTDDTLIVGDICVSTDTPVQTDSESSTTVYWKIITTNGTLASTNITVNGTINPGNDSVTFSLLADATSASLTKVYDRVASDVTYTLTLQSGTSYALCGTTTSSVTIPELSGAPSLVKFNSTVTGITETNDNNYVVTGGFTEYNGSTSNDTRILKLLSSAGLHDNTFTVGSGFNTAGHKIIATSSLTTDNKILVGGNFTSYNGTGANRIIRLNSDGSIDTSFVYGSGFEGSQAPNTFSVTETSDGSYLITGFYTTYNGVSVSYFAKLQDNGALNTTFNTNIGSGFGAYTQSSIEVSDGNYIIVGTYGSVDGNVIAGVVKVDSDGTVNSTFISNANNGLKPYGGTTAGYAAAEIGTSGKYLIGGSFAGYGNDLTGLGNLVLINSNGSRDSSFNSGENGIVGIVWIIKPITGGYLIGGRFTEYNGTPVGNLVKINSSGALDTTFNTNIGNGAQGGGTTEITDIKVTSSGHYLIGGNFTEFNSDPNEFRFMKLDSNGNKIW